MFLTGSDHVVVPLLTRSNNAIRPDFLHSVLNPSNVYINFECESMKMSSSSCDLLIELWIVKKLH